MNLEHLARSYLEAEDYEVAERERDLLVGSRKAVGGDTEFIYVWVPDFQDAASTPRRLPSLLTRFGQINDVHPQALKFMLVPSLEGLTGEFRRDAKRWFNVGVRVPTQFFDTPFTWEGSPEAPSAAKQQKARGRERSKERAPQPYRTNGARGKDLLETLFTALREGGRRSNRSIHVVVGPAGMGKSYLFESLFARLHDQYLEDKRRQEPSARPMPLLPENSRGSDPPAVRLILQNYLESDFARPLSEPVFEWMITNGFGMWLLDGLDEVIAQDPGFFDYLLDLMTRPEGGQLPTILLCVRDSLLATNEDLKDFCNDWAEHVSVYELTAWEEPSRKHFAWVTLGTEADAFLSTLKMKPHLLKLAGLPFYCNLLRLQFESGNLEEIGSEVQLLDLAVKEIVKRDYAKGFIDPATVEESDVLDFVETLASVDLEGDLRGIAVQDVRMWAELLLPADVREDELERLIGQLSKLAIFAYAGPGKVRFAQEVLEHYLVGRSLITLLEANQDAFLGRLSVKQIPAEWISLRVVAEFMQQRGLAARIPALLLEAANRPNAFKNVLQLAALMGGEAGALTGIPFEGHDLSGIVFDGVDFNGVSFRRCDLTNTEFRNCKLASTVFEEAVLRNTLIPDSAEALRGASVGDLGRFYSIRIGGKQVITQPREAAAWFMSRTGQEVRAVEPCDAAWQLRHLFGKFVHANGQARRSRLNRKAALAGRRFMNPEDMLEGAVRHGYLTREPPHGHITRPSGDAYSELVAFVMALSITPGISALLSDVCSIPGCVHVPPARPPR